MCGAHRKDVIAHIKERLKAKREGRDTRPLRVVSTQLVEAGVDIDFPVVYRALAGLDSIAQAAGRCNREGRMQGLGRVVVFVPPERPPLGHLRKGADACISTLHGQAQDPQHDPLARGLFARYFTEFYHSVDLDQHRVVNLLTVQPRDLAMKFRTAAGAFRLIDDAESVTVVVRYAAHQAHIDSLLNTLTHQRPTALADAQAAALHRHHPAAPGHANAEPRRPHAAHVPGLYVLANTDNLYSNILGLLSDADVYNPSGFAL